MSLQWQFSLLSTRVVTRHYLLDGNLKVKVKTSFRRVFFCYFGMVNNSSGFNRSVDDIDFASRLDCRHPKILIIGTVRTRWLDLLFVLEYNTGKFTSTAGSSAKNNTLR